MTPTALDRLAWAISAPIDDATVWRTLVVLADHADASGLAWPKIERLGEVIRRGDRQTRAAVDALVDAGYVARVRLRSGGRLRGYLFRVLIPGAPPVEPSMLPAFAAHVDLPDAWRRHVSTGGRPPDVDPPSTGGAPPLHYRRSAAGQEPPIPEPPSTSSLSSSDDRLDDPTTEVAAKGWADARTLAEYLAEAVVYSGGPDADRPTVTRAWIETMERLVRIDGRDPDKVRAAIDWVHRSAPGSTGAWWTDKILSPDALRRHYEKMRRQAGRDRTGPALADGYEQAAKALRARSSR